MANKRSPFNTTLTLTVADTEYPYTFPVGAVSLYLKSRSNYRIKLSWQSGESGTTYFGVGDGSSYSEDGLYAVGGAPLILYAQCPVAGAILEIVGWRA